MALRYFPRLVGGLALVFSGWVSALGLGEIELNSALNEPLDAEIEILNPGDLSQGELLVGLASPEDFQRAGVAREFLLTALNFNIDFNAPGGPVIRVTSRDPIREPYLDFLVEAQWPSGRLLREYTVLLDLPLFAGEDEGKVEAAATGPERQASGRAAAKTADPGARSTAGAEYRVRAGDTLWKIASNLNGTDATVYQKMAAIERLNPNAFINGDLNMLRRGHVLRLPENTRIAEADARRVRERMLARRDTGEDTPATGQPLSASPRSPAPTGTEAPAEGRLQLSAADDSGTASGGAAVGTGTGGGGGARMAGEIDQIQEELEKTQRENAELKERLGKLEEQLSTMQRLVELNDEGLRASQLAAQGAARSEAETAPADEGGKEEPAPGPQEQDAESTAAQAAPEETRPAQDDRGGGPWGLLLYGLGFLVLLAAVVAGALIWKRKRDEAGEQLFSEAVEPVGDEAPMPDEFEPPRDSGQRVESLDEIELAEDDHLFDIDRDESESASPELELSEEEQVDALNEADIYISLGNYDEARRLLDNALEKEPGNVDLHLKKLELFVAQDNLDAFDEHRPALSALGDDEAERRADEFRAELTASAGEQEPAAVEAVEEGDETVVGDEMTESLAADTTEEDDEASLPGGPEDDIERENLQAPASELPGTEEQTEEPTDESLGLAADLREIEEHATEPDAESVEEAIEEDDALEKLQVPGSPDVGAGSSDTEADDDLLAGFEGVADQDLSEDPGEEFDIDLSEFELDDSISTGESVEASTGGDSEDWLEQNLEDGSAVVETGSSGDSLDLDDELDLLGDTDEFSTQLELAEAYIDMGDAEGAREILSEVAEKGSDEQQEKARKLLDTLE